MTEPGDNAPAPVHPHALPNTPPLTAELLDRYERLLRHAAEQHQQQIEQARLLVQEANAVRQRQADSTRDARDQEMRLQALDASARFMGPAITGLLTDTPMDEEAFDQFVSRAAQAWVAVAESAIRYAREEDGAPVADLAEASVMLLHANRLMSVMDQRDGQWETTRQAWANQLTSFLNRCSTAGAAAAAYSGLPEPPEGV
jgi:hypothetical protein